MAQYNNLTSAKEKMQVAHSPLHVQRPRAQKIYGAEHIRPTNGVQLVRSTDPRATERLGKTLQRMGDHFLMSLPLQRPAKPRLEVTVPRINLRGRLLLHALVRVGELVRVQMTLDTFVEALNG